MSGKKLEVGDKVLEAMRRGAIMVIPDEAAFERARVAELRAQLRAVTLTRDLLATWVTELQDELTQYREVADGLAVELEQCRKLVGLSKTPEAPHAAKN